MDRKALNLIFLASLLTICLLGLFILLPAEPERQSLANEIEKPEKTEVDPLRKKAARGEYYFRMLRNPATNSIPENVRRREIEAAKRIPPRTNMDVKFRHKQGKLLDFHEFSWNLAGPYDVGGRTRAMAVDITDPNMIIAGGVSGGIWKSTDGGSTWEMKTSDFTNLSVTSLAQDPNSPNTWYYVTGEFLGSSASDRGFTAPYYGTGVFRSTDNGETWSQIPSTADENTSWNSPYDFISRVVISPVTGSVFIASHGFGVLKLNESTQQFELIHGGPGEHLYADVIVNSEGDLLAVLSESDAGQTQTNAPGVYLSTNDGSSWTNITPSGFPDTHRRSVAAFAPSDPAIAYVLTLKGRGDESNQGVSFYKFDLNADSAEDRSEHLPDFGEPVGNMDLQGGYNMMVAVKPDDPDFVLVGGITLFRSRDGFATSPSGGYDNTDDSQKDEYWIGGYTKENRSIEYPNHHPDQHEFFFDPGNPDRMWSAHDGGISVTDDITASSVSWNEMNESYITSQFYSVAISDEIGDTRVMGGTQDNGTPFFRFDGQNSQDTFSDDISFGDGGYAYFTPGYLYVARQEGSIIRYQRSESGDPTTPFAYVDPIDVEEQLFVHPYIVDPNDEGIMYYPGAGSEGGTWNIWRNTEVDEITNSSESDGATQGWEQLSNIDVPSGYNISALTVSRSPANILFYAGSSDDRRPVLYKLINAHEATSGAEDISIPGADGGSYIHDIEVSPTNADELIVVISNYEVESIFHTNDGGDTWEAVEGNLGDDVNLGSSVRSAVIIPGEEGNIYFVGTSTGIYSTTDLNGTNTSWNREATDQIGFAVVEQINARYADGSIIAGTHGIGTYLGAFGGNISLPAITVDPQEARAGDIVTITASNFQFDPDPANNEVTFGTRFARVIEAETDQLLVEVPRGAIPREAESNTIQVKVEVGSNSASQTFNILPPENFTLKQNYPNPFNPTTRIPFDVPSDSWVTVQIFNVNGQKVREPIRVEEFNAGTYDTPVDMSGLASGIYIYRVVVQEQANNGELFMDSHKMTFVK